MVLEIARIPTAELQTELIRRRAELPVKIREPIKVVSIMAMPEKEPSEVWEFDLDTERNFELLSDIPPGDFVLASTDGTLSGIEIRLGLTKGAGANPHLTWYLDKTNEIRRVFRYIFLKNNVQVGKKLWLQIGRETLAVSAVSQVVSAEFKNKVSAIVASTTSVLGAAAEYASSEFSLEDSARIIGSCFADQNGTLYIEQRNDGTNWDVQSEFTYTANERLGFSVEVVGNEGRLRYVNGATPQTIFRLYARLRRV
ncbi:MAG: hypothetical protein JRC66_06660 [Deltaproteobacteria bacterium]|nr:hypothetical protein [Deltaproteobacteria bacterium]